MPPKSIRSSKASKQDGKRKAPRSSSSKRHDPANLSLSDVSSKPSFKTSPKNKSPKKASAGRLPSLEHGIDNLLSPGQLADGEDTPPARPVRGKLPTTTISRLPDRIKQRSKKEEPYDSGAMDITEDVPWTRPSVERRTSPLPRSTELRQNAAADAFLGRTGTTRRRFPFQEGPLRSRQEAAVDAFADSYTPPARNRGSPRPAQQAPDKSMAPEFADPRQQAEALLTGRTSPCTMPGRYTSGGRKSYRTHLFDELLALGFAYHVPERPIPAISDTERQLKMRSTDPTAVLQNYDDYGILPRDARTNYPAFKLPRTSSRAHSRQYWTRYTNMCLAAEKTAIEAWARTLFLRAHAISEEELAYNESLGLVDHKYRVLRPLHRINPRPEDWDDALSDYDREELSQEMEDVIRDSQGRSLGKPVRKLWRSRIPSNVFKENTETFENALDAYWDYHDCGLIPKGTMKHIPYPEREALRGAGDLIDDPMEFDYEESSPQISAIQERQWQSQLRRAEQLYIYEWAKALRAKELDLSIDEFEKYLSTGEIDAAWSGFTEDSRRVARSATPAAPTQRRAFAAPILAPAPAPYRPNPPAEPRLPLEARIQHILFSARSRNRSCRTNALWNGVITTPYTPVPPRSAGEAAFFLHAYITNGMLPPTFTQPALPRVQEWHEFESQQDYESYLWDYERDCRILEQDSVLRFLRHLRAEELGLTYEQFKKNRGEGRITGYVDGWKVVETLAQDGAEAIERAESRWEGEDMQQPVLPARRAGEWMRRRQTGRK